METTSASRGRPRKAIDSRSRAEVLAARRNNQREKAVKVLSNLHLLPDAARVNQHVIEAALNISPSSALRRIAEGRIPAPHKDGRTNYWLACEVRKLLEGGA